MCSSDPNPKFDLIRNLIKPSSRFDLHIVLISLLQAVRRGQEESDLERIQDLFPNDCLYLYDKDVVTMVSPVLSPFGTVPLETGLNILIVGDILDVKARVIFIHY